MVREGDSKQSCQNRFRGRAATEALRPTKSMGKDHEADAMIQKKKKKSKRNSERG